MTRSKQQASAAYDRLSPWYDLLSGGSERPLAELGLKILNAGPGEYVLEIGYGTGHALVALAAAVGETGRVVGIDISRGMAGVARERTARAKVSHRIVLEQGDAAALPFKPDFFDAIFISFALELFDTPEISVVLLECRRVLKTGGRICVVAMARDEDENLPQRIYEWFHVRLPAYVDCRPIFLRSTLALAGFQIKETIRKQMWGLPVEIVAAHSQ